MFENRCVQKKIHGESKTCVRITTKFEKKCAKKNLKMKIKHVE